MQTGWMRAAARVCLFASAIGLESQSESFSDGYFVQSLTQISLHSGNPDHENDTRLLFLKETSVALHIFLNPHVRLENQVQGATATEALSGGNVLATRTAMTGVGFDDEAIRDGPSAKREPQSPRRVVPWLWRGKTRLSREGASDA